VPHFTSGAAHSGAADADAVCTSRYAYDASWAAEYVSPAGQAAEFSYHAVLPTSC
jgi:hypothetical protein